MVASLKYCIEISQFCFRVDNRMAAAINYRRADVRVIRTAPFNQHNQNESLKSKSICSHRYHLPHLMSSRCRWRNVNDKISDIIIYIGPCCFDDEAVKHYAFCSF